MDMSRLNCRTGLSYPDQFSRSATALHAAGEIQTTRRHRRTEWDEVYKRMVDNGFAKKVVMDGTRAKAGESYAWVIANPGRGLGDL